MSDENRSLILDLVEWIARRPRPYGEVMEAWRTSCPRLTIWEDAVDQGLVVRQHKGSKGPYVSVTKPGLALLAAEGRQPVAGAHRPSANLPDPRKAGRV